MAKKNFRAQPLPTTQGKPMSDKPQDEKPVEQNSSGDGQLIQQEQQSNEGSQAPGVEDQDIQDQSGTQEQEAGESVDAAGDAADAGADVAASVLSPSGLEPETPPAVQAITPETPPAAPQVKAPDTPPPPPVEVKTTVSDVADTSVVPATASTYDQMVARIEEKGTVAQKKLLQELQHYADVMKRGRPMTAEKGAGHQQRLWDILKGVVTTPGADEFRVQWNIVLITFDHFKNDAMGPKHVFRFPESWIRDPGQLIFKQRLVNIIHLTANPETRQEELRRVDIARSTDGAFTEEFRARLAGFYGQ